MHKFESSFFIENKKIGINQPSYFIADIAANHDGSLQKAIDLINLAADAGADAAKFQHFTAETIVSANGFNALANLKSHQSQWKKSVFDVYKEAELSLNWTSVLREECNKVGITFFTSPYSIEIVDKVDPYVPAYKIGSGDITWIQIIEHVASKNKPIMLATGASSLEDVARAIEAIQKFNSQAVLMQCNTNYTGSIDNLKYVNLNVLKTYRRMYPDIILGLSDHTPGHATVLGAIAIGAKVIEKHFTDNTGLIGPDHAFSMDPRSWSEMVLRTRELEAALGTEFKKIEFNENETSVLQRRCICAISDISSGDLLTNSNIGVLRPSPEGALPPYKLDLILGKKIIKNKKTGDPILISDVTS